MRRILLLVWLMVPVLVGAYHYGPGQERLVLDDAARFLAEGERHAEAGEWFEAEASYSSALELLPGDRTEEIRRVLLERDKAWMLTSRLPDAHHDLVDLVDQIEASGTSDETLAAEAREALAGSRYYMTWLMRLEGQPPERWEPQIEGARQGYRLLAERADAAGDAGASARYREGLESSIRLARMDLGELQGLPLPSQ